LAEIDRERLEKVRGAFPVLNHRRFFVNNMRIIIKCFLLAFTLASCGTTKDARYRDTAMLERPPILPIIRQPGEQRITDNSTIPKKTDETGLGEAVYMTTTTPPQLKIKQPFDEAWKTLNQALKQNDLKITDQERNKGHLYVQYGSNSLFEKAKSFLINEQKESNYLLTVKKEGSETTITVATAKTTEETSSYNSSDGYYEEPVDISQKLLEKIYTTIRDDLKEE
jgi:hypothetical protein